MAQTMYLALFGPVFVTATDKTGICVGTDMLKFRLLFSHYK